MSSPTRIPFTSTRASVLLDLMRALAALLVCVEHWRNLFFVDYRQIASRRLLFAIPYVLSDAGHQAVVIFFVLSGYLISGSVFRLFQREQWSWKLYLTHRLVRLWIVLVPALLLGAALDFIGLHWKLAPALYAGQTGTHMLGNIAASLHAHIFFGNLAFLQTILVPTLGSNGPLWSLAYEFWYYILFPCALLALRRKTSMFGRIVHAVLFLACGALAGKEILLLFPIWLLGTLLAVVPPAHVGNGLRVLAAVFYCPLFFFLAKQSAIPGMLSDYVLAAATFLLIWLLLGARDAAPSARWVSVTRTMARFSYTLYLAHVPFLVLLTALLAGNNRWQPDARHLLPGIFVLLLAIAYAFGVASLTEFRTDTVRGWVERLLLGKPVQKKVSVDA